MYGTNKISKQRTKEEGFLVHSVFYTIQGEGPWAGLPTIFLRLAGCNLQCDFCFVGNTIVTMHDGKSKRIADVRLNDMVMSIDQNTRQLAPKRVIRTMQSKTKELVAVRTIGNDVLIVTPNHPILSDRGWIKAGELQPGDDLSAERARDIVVSVTPIPIANFQAFAELVDGEALVYNLEVEDWHTYVANGKVVHNCDTEFTEGAKLYSLQNLVIYLRNMAFHHNCQQIVITGGEPMLQPLTELLTMMPSSFAFQIETAGTVWPKGFEQAMLETDCLIVCSPKTPKVNLAISTYCKHYKYIIQASDEFSEKGLPTKVYHCAHTFVNKKHIYLQPCDVPDPIEYQANIAKAVQLCMAYGYRLSIQVHKVANVP